MPAVLPPAFFIGVGLLLAPAISPVVTLGWRDVARRIGAGATLWSAEYPVEEVVAAAIAVAAAPIHANRHAYRLGRRILRPFDCDIGDLALAALEDREHLGVAAGDLFAHLPLAGIIHARLII